MLQRCSLGRLLERSRCQTCAQGRCIELQGKGSYYGTPGPGTAIHTKQASTKHPGSEPGSSSQTNVLSCLPCRIKHQPQKRTHSPLTPLSRQAFEKSQPEAGILELEVSARTRGPGKAAACPTCPGEAALPPAPRLPGHTNTRPAPTASLGHTTRAASFQLSTRCARAAA